VARERGLVENNPDPRLIQTPEEFAESLRMLRERTGLSLRAIALRLLRKKSSEAPTYTTLDDPPG